MRPQSYLNVVIKSPVLIFCSNLDADDDISPTICFKLYSIFEFSRNFFLSNSKQIKPGVKMPNSKHHEKTLY
jgi:hypothetical protein